MVIFHWSTPPKDIGSQSGKRWTQKSTNSRLLRVSLDVGLE
jgi:hypothetical protein